jgi:ankyrin repeat protein
MSVLQTKADLTATDSRRLKSVENPIVNKLHLTLALFLLCSIIRPSIALPIHDAAQSGDLEELRQLIEAGEDIEGLDDAEYTPLLRAVSGGSEDAVKFLLDKGANANASATTYDDYEDTQTVDALGEAIKNDQIAIIEPLLSHGATIQPAHLTLAICKGKFGTTQMLIAHGASIGTGALGSAVECGNKEALTYLIAKAGKIDFSSLSNSGNYFSHAAESPTKELFEQLFAGDANFKIHAPKLIGYAISSENADLAAYLISKGVDVSQLEVNASLLSSAQYSNIKMVELLLGNNFKFVIDTRTDWGNTPLLLATPHGNTDIASLLIKKGADVNAKNEFFNTPLHMATARNLTEMASLLIAKGARVNALNVDRNTPLHQALRFSGKFETVQLLLGTKANVNAKNRRGMTPLHYLAIRNSAYMDYEADPSQEYYQDPDGLNPWQRPDTDRLDETERIRIAKLLLKNGADLKIQNARGETALELSRVFSQSDELVKLLEKSVVAAP